MKLLDLFMGIEYDRDLMPKHYHTMSDKEIDEHIELFTPF